MHDDTGIISVDHFILNEVYGSQVFSVTTTGIKMAPNHEVNHSAPRERNRQSQITPGPSPQASDNACLKIKLYRPNKWSAPMVY